MSMPAAVLRLGAPGSDTPAVLAALQLPSRLELKAWVEAISVPDVLARLAATIDRALISNPNGPQLLIGALIACVGVALMVSSMRRRRRRRSDAEVMREFALRSGGEAGRDVPSQVPMATGDTHSNGWHPNGAAAGQAAGSVAMRTPRAPAYLFPDLPPSAAGRPANPVPLGRSMVRIGRHEENDVQFRHKSVHRYHAVVHRTPDGDFIITDLSGLAGNGVYVNGARVEQSSLRTGDLVELGAIRMRFQDQRALM